MSRICGENWTSIGGSNVTAPRYNYTREELYNWAQFKVIISVYVFSIPFVFGVVGNCLNLFVLSSKRMKSKTNILLASMAFSDVAFLCAMAVVNVMGHPNFRLHYYSSHVFYKQYIADHMIAAVNWFSTASAWFVLAVSTERLLAVASPLQLYTTRTKLICVLVLIWLLSFVLTFNHHVTKFWYLEENPKPGRLPQPIFCWRWPHYHRVSLVLQMVLQVLLPAILIILINVLLIIHLRRQNTSLAKQMDTHPRYGKKLTTPKSKESRPSLVTSLTDRFIGGSDSIITTPDMHNNNNNDVPKCSAMNNASVQSSLADRHLHRRRHIQRRVTVTVCTISICFVITHLPSALWGVVRDVSQHKPLIFYYLSACTNTLVVFGKALNFVLFCVASQSFRHRLPCYKQTNSLMAQHRLRSNKTNSTATNGTTTGSSAVLALKRMFSSKKDTNAAAKIAVKHQLTHAHNQTNQNGTSYPDRNGVSPFATPVLDKKLINNNGIVSQNRANGTASVKHHRHTEHQALVSAGARKSVNEASVWQMNGKSDLDWEADECMADIQIERTTNV